jgi:hypothetical protein
MLCTEAREQIGPLKIRKKRKVTKPKGKPDTDVDVVTEAQDAQPPVEEIVAEPILGAVAEAV